MRLRSTAHTLSLLAPCALAIAALTALAALAGCAPRMVDVGTVLQAGQLRIADKAVVHVKDGKHDYYALVAKDTTKGGAFARAQVHSSTFTVTLFEGYMYLWGTYPVGGTINVNAAATGTTIIIEMLPDRERVYLLVVDGDETVTVSLTPGTKPVVGGVASRTLNAHEYVECVYAPGNRFNLLAPQPIPLTSGPIRTFLDKAQTDVAAAGLGGWPSPWPW